MIDPTVREIGTRNLASWLSYIEQLHPKSIAMGLERVSRVIERLALNPNFSIITVAGTNGKGSTCAMLSQTYLEAGYRVGCYSSPHLLRYNERVRVNNQEVNDAALCAAFEAVEHARLGIQPEHEEIPLTYFEIGTLAAMWHFSQAKLDIAILEIGLGGRLDAVNAFESDCAVVTSVDLDHQEFLGETREQIGLEKAGVYRPGKPAICGDENPPQALIAYASKIGADFKSVHRDFDYLKTQSGWTFIFKDEQRYTLPNPALEGNYQLLNAACVVAAVESMQHQLPVKLEAIASAMRHVKIAGRFDLVMRQPQLILDVAHNPHAAQALASNLQAHYQSGTKTYAVFAMLADKDIAGVVNAVKQQIDIWYVATIDHVRKASVEVTADAIRQAAPGAIIKTFNTVADACEHAIADMQACIDANENDKIIAFGSFFTVADVMRYLNECKAIKF